MKRALTVAALLAPSLLPANPADYVNFIRQVQQDTGLEWDVAVLASGEQVSPTGVSADGAFFELWSIHNLTVTEFLLDEQFVTSYTPNASIVILTADTYGPVRRTRVDQPFQVQISVSGLLDPADPNYGTAPDAAKWVDYSHAVFDYPAGAHSLEEVENPVGTLINEGYMEESADTTITFGATNLSGNDLTLVEGEEVFTISAQADFGVSETVLSSEKVQIWPIATGTISGTDPTQYYESVPPMSVNLLDLYPASTTYLRIYHGASTSSPTEFKTVSASYVIIEDSIPQDRQLLVKEMDQYFTDEGFHTVELVHNTPFGADILHSISVNVDRTIEINGGVVDQE